MQPYHRLHINPAFVVEKFDDEFLLYAVACAKGVYLNQTAALIWEMCENDLTVDQMISLLEASYPEQKEMIRQEVATAIDSLVATGALLVDLD